MVTTLKGDCQRCNRTQTYIECHHLIPRWCGGEDGPTINVCVKCHRLLDTQFLNFIKYGKFLPTNRKSWQSTKKGREYNRQYTQKWREENPEKRKAQTRRDYQRYREQQIEKGKAYYKLNQEERLAYQKKYNLEHRKERLAYGRIWRTKKHG